MSDESLFTSKEVAGFTVTPWTLGQIVKLVPVFERIAVRLAERGIRLSSVLAKLKESPMEVAGLVLPEMAEVFCVTLKAEKDRVESLRVDQVLELTITILQQNVDYLKNSLGPVTAAIARLGATT